MEERSWKFTIEQGDIEMKRYFDGFSISSLESEVEEYGQECYDDGYEDGKEDALKGLVSSGELISGLIERTHLYKGEWIKVWIEGPDFKGDRYAW